MTDSATPGSPAETEATAKRPYSLWLGLGGALLGFLLPYAAGNGLSYLLMAVGVQELAAGVDLFFSSVSFALAVVLFITFAGKWRTVRDFLSLRNFHWKQLILAAVSAIALYAIAICLGIISWKISEATGVSLGENQTTQKISAAVGSATFVLISLVAALTAPLVEELFFRGALLSSLVQEKTSKLLRIGAVVFVAALFGWFHTQGFDGSVASWMAMLVPAVVGAWCAMLTLKTKSIYPAIMTHMLYNSIVLLSVAGLL